MPTAHEVARQHYDQRQRLVIATAAAAMAMWSEVDEADLSGSWLARLPRLLTLLRAAQRAAAAQADSYVTRALAVQGFSPSPAGEVVPDALAGIGSDGRPLVSLLQAPVVATKVALARGVTLDRAIATGRANLEMVVRTQVADAGRVADGVAVAARPRTGYTRLLVPPSCGRCVILAGRYYRWNDGFARHPNCFPAGVAVSGPASQAATRRWFEGELVILATASGQKLPVTGNHPILTRRGWVPANLLNEGDEVVRSTNIEGATPLVVPDHHQVPSLIEDVWSALSVGGFERMPASPEYFHGDGQGGEVDVVYADGALLDGFQSSLSQQVVQLGLAGRLSLADELLMQGAAVFVDLLDSAHARSAVRGSGLGFPFLGGHLGRSGCASLASVAAFDSRLDEASRDDIARDAVLAAQRVLADSSLVGGHDLVDREIASLARWDAPGGAFSVETAGRYASRGLDLLNRLAGQVELDRVVELRRVEWSGHVYSLTSVEGWHAANNLIVSNCDCIHVPATEDTSDDLRTNPEDYFESLSHAEQDRVFTKAGAQAVRDGADMNQVVNARRGAVGLSRAGGRLTREEQRMLRGGRDRGRLQRTDVFGQQVFTTTEGTTTRGVAGRRLREQGAGTVREAAETVTRRGRAGDVQRRVSRRRVQTPRLMPESIYEIASSRDEAVRLLRRFGYIT